MATQINWSGGQNYFGDPMDAVSIANAGSAAVSRGVQDLQNILKDRISAKAGRDAKESAANTADVQALYDDQARFGNLSDYHQNSGGLDRDSLVKAFGQNIDTGAVQSAGSAQLAKLQNTAYDVAKADALQNVGTSESARGDATARLIASLTEAGMLPEEQAKRANLLRDDITKGIDRSRKDERYYGELTDIDRATMATAQNQAITAMETKLQPLKESNDISTAQLAQREYMDPALSDDITKGGGFGAYVSTMTKGKDNDYQKYISDAQQGTGVFKGTNLSPAAADRVLRAAIGSTREDHDNWFSFGFNDAVFSTAVKNLIPIEQGLTDLRSEAISNKKAYDQAVTAGNRDIQNMESDWLKEFRSAKRTGREAKLSPGDQLKTTLQGKQKPTTKKETDYVTAGRVKAAANKIRASLENPINTSLTQTHTTAPTPGDDARAMLAGLRQTPNNSPVNIYSGPDKINPIVEGSLLGNVFGPDNIKATANTLSTAGKTLINPITQLTEYVGDIGQNLNTAQDKRNFETNVTKLIAQSTDPMLAIREILTQDLSPDERAIIQKILASSGE